MDVAYDAVQEESYPTPSPTDDNNTTTETTTNHAPTHTRRPTLNQEISTAYKALSDSTWGSTVTSWWGTVKKQGESYYSAAQKELSSASQSSASRGVSDLVSNTGTLSLDQPDSSPSTPTPTDPTTTDRKPHPDAPESLSKDIVKEAETLLTTFRSLASSRLKQVQAAEDAADEALIKFGSNIRTYLKDAVTVTAPPDSAEGSVNDVLFESRDQDGRRVVHATRFDAQLHVIHANTDSFTADPPSDAFATWKGAFNIDHQTTAIAHDLDKYPELRRSMEALVPERVEYQDFWRRYYFLRHVLEAQEQKRRELLRATGVEEEVKWDDDDDDEEEEEEPKAPGTPRAGAADTGAATPKTGDGEEGLKPAERRRSNENSVADSDASYDIVSGGGSRGPGSPRVDKEKREKEGEESDDEDWE